MPAETPVATVDVVMPARDEATTVASNVAAAAGCRFVREVIVVDDGSRDGTGALAAGAGARVIRRDPGGSKAHAMDDGVRASDATHILFVDADCTGLTSAHLDAICEPVLAGEAEMSLGAFDYGPLSWLVLVLPPLSGERIIPRWVWDAIPPEHIDGYTIESRIDQVIAEGGHRTSVRRMRGVFHRTKRDKLGRLAGYRGTIRMYRDLFGLLRPFGDIRWRAYVSYLRNLSIDRA
jgi:glycosyltransferase involved in cell wall biosynthesis